MPTAHNNFKPIANLNSKVLILGTFPGKISREKNEYYGNSRNQFWKIITEILNIELSAANYSEKIQILQSSEIALWDIISSCETDGSLDSEIRNEQLIDLPTFLSDFPNIKLILFNGQNAAKYAKKLGTISLSTLILPSTSPANATKSYAQKLEAWKNAINSAINAKI